MTSHRANADLRALSSDDLESFGQQLVDWGADLSEPDICYLLELGRVHGGIDDAGGLITAVSAVGHGDLAWIHLWGPQSGELDRSLATLLIDHACDSLEGEPNVIGADAELEFMGLFSNLGFREVARISRLTAPSPGVPTEDDRTPAVIRSMEESDLGEIVFYEEDLIGGERMELLTHLFDFADFGAYIATVGQWGAGFAFARQCQDGVRIGPVFAEDEDIARAFLRRILESVDDAAVIEVPFRKTGQWVRMLKGDDEPRSEFERMFAVAGVEFG